jgi:hypothetical protein
MQFSWKDEICKQGVCGILLDQGKSKSWASKKFFFSYHLSLGTNSGTQLMIQISLKNKITLDIACYDAVPQPLWLHLSYFNFCLLCPCSFGLNTPTAVVDSTEVEYKDDVELEDEGEVVLVEKVHDDGSVEKIVFASGVEVDVYELEILCDKVVEFCTYAWKLFGLFFFCRVVMQWATFLDILLAVSSDH